MDILQVSLIILATLLLRQAFAIFFLRRLLTTKLEQDVTGKVTTINAEAVELGPPEKIAMVTQAENVRVTFVWHYEGSSEPAYFHIRNGQGLLQVARVDFNGKWVKGSSMLLKWEWSGKFAGPHQVEVIPS